MTFSECEAAAYLAGMIDGEGWIGEPKGVWNRAVRITNTDRVLIDAITEACGVLGITYTVQTYVGRKAHWSPGWLVDITRKSNLEKIHARVPFRSVAKRERLARVLASYRMPDPLDPAVIRRLVDQGLSRREIARELGVGLKRVQRVVVLHEIPSPDWRVRSASIWRERRRRYGSSGRGTPPGTSLGT